MKTDFDLRYSSMSTFCLVETAEVVIFSSAAGIVSACGIFSSMNIVEAIANQGNLRSGRKLMCLFRRRITCMSLEPTLNEAL